MMWESEVMTWDEIIWTKNVPTPDRGQYVWMRTIVGSGSWQYTRLTGSTLQDSDYFGVLDEAPTTTPDGKNLIAGDSYVDSETNAIKVYNGSSWVSLAYSGLTSAKQSEVAGKAQKEVLSRIQPNSVTESDYGYFNTLIAGTVTADYIKGQEGVFNSIHVSGDSMFDGKVRSKVFETFDFQPSKQLSFTGSSIPKDTLDSIFGRTGYFSATSGSISIDSTSYQATSTNPIIIFYGIWEFAIIARVGGSTYGFSALIENGIFKSVNGKSITSNSLVLPYLFEHVEVADTLPFTSGYSTLGDPSKRFKDVWIKENLFEQSRGCINLPNGMSIHFGTIPSSSMIYNAGTGIYTCHLTALQNLKHLRFSMALWGSVHVDVIFRTVIVPTFTFSTTSEGVSDVKYLLIADNND